MTIGTTGSQTTIVEATARNYGISVPLRVSAQRQRAISARSSLYLSRTYGANAKWHLCKFQSVSHIICGTQQDSRDVITV